MTAAERYTVVRLAEQEPGELLALLAGCLAPQVVSATVAAVPCPAVVDAKRIGDDPFLISEDEFSYRAQRLSLDEQAILRCRVNAARAHQSGRLDDARRYRQRADRLEKKLAAS